MKLFKVMQKNFNILFRSKFTGFLFLFGPLLVILLVGFAFNNFGQYKILVGTYSDDYSSLAKDFVIELSASNFRVTKYTSESDCINDIKYGSIHTCLVFPEHFDVLSDNNTLKFYVDPSNSNLVWMVVDEVSKKIETSSSKVRYNLTQDIMSRIYASINMSSDLSELLIQISDSVGSVDSDMSSLSAKSSSLDLGVDEITSASSIKTSDVGTNLDELYDETTSAVEETQDLIDAIRDSSTWDDITNKTELDDLLDAAESSISTIKSSAEKEYNSTNDALVVVVESLYNLDDDLSQISDMLDSVANTRTQLIDSITDIRNSLKTLQSDLSLAEDKSSLIRSTLSGMSVKSAGSIATPVSTEVIEITDDAEESHLNFFFPALIILMIMFVGLLLSALNIVMEKNSRAYFRNFITPTGDSLFVVASFMTNFIILFAELILILGVTYLAFDATILENLGVTALILFMCISFFIILGMIVGYLFTSEEAAILGTISLSCIFFFISNLILPLDALPEKIKYFVKFNPFIITNDLLKRSLLFNSSFSALAGDLILFAIYILGAIVLLFIMQKVMKLKFFYHNSLKNKKVHDVIETNEIENTDSKSVNAKVKKDKKDTKPEPEVKSK